MSVVLPENIETQYSPKDVALNFAIGLYVSKEVTLGQASEIAGLNQSQFQHELGAREIPLNYSMKDLEIDIAAVRELSAQ